MFLILMVNFLWACNTNSGQPEARQETATAPTATDSTATDASQEKVILFFGNSLTAGYGLESSEAFPALIQNRLDSLGYEYQVVNAGLSGETTASGSNRLDWILERQPIDIFVLELGANDGLRGINPAETRKNLMEMIDKVRNTYPESKIILTGMMVPPNMGPEYSEKFQKMFPEIAEEKQVALVPFLLQDVAGETELNQADGIHPTAEGHKMLADNVWEVLKEVLDTPA